VQNGELRRIVPPHRRFGGIREHKPMTSSPRYIRPRHAAERIGVSTSTLAQWRCRGEGPPFAKLSATVVVYDADALDKWVSQRVASSTAEAARLPVGGAHAA